MPEPLPPTLTIVSAPPTPKSHNFLVLVLIILCVLLLSSTLVLVYQVISLKKQLAVSQVSTPPTPIPVTESIKIPQKEALYYGEYYEESSKSYLPIIFFTNDENSVYYVSGQKKSDPNIGSVTSENGSGRSPVNFNDVHNSKKLYLSDKPIVQVVNFKSDPNKKFIYISLMIQKSDEQLDFLNRIVSINMLSGETKIIWENTLINSKYNNLGGASHIQEVFGNQYLWISLFGCYACEPGDKTGALVINIANGAEKLVGIAGNIQVIFSNNTFTYQKLQEFKIPCDFGPGCDSDGTRKVHKPAGTTYTDNLPL